jgi:hypothetical protein
MIVASPESFRGWIAYDERPRPEGTPDSGQWRKMGAHNLSRISAVPPGRGHILLPIPGTSYLATFIQSLRDKKSDVLLQRPANGEWRPGGTACEYS